MSSTALWSIAGIVVTVIVSFLIYRLQKVRKYPSQLSYTILSKSKVLQHAHGSFNDISLRYNDYSVSLELHYLEVMVFNPRSSDVGNANTESTVSLTLPSLSKWLDVKIKSESPSVGSSISISLDSDLNAVLSFKLLKKNEFIVIEGLVESVFFFNLPEEKLLTFNHRIPNLDIFRNVPHVSDNIYKANVNNLRWAVFVFIALLSLSVFRFISPSSSRILYSDSVEKKVYSASMNKKEQIILNEVGNSSLKSETIPFDEFSSRFSPVCLYKKPPMSLVQPVLFLILCLLVLAVSIDDIRTIKRYHLLKQIKGK